MRLFDVEEDVPDAPEAIPFGVADIKRVGTDVTIVGHLARGARRARRRRRAGHRGHLGGGRRPADAGALRPRRDPHVGGQDRAPHRRGRGPPLGGRGRGDRRDRRGARLRVAAKPIRRVATLDVPIPFSPPLERFVEPGRESGRRGRHRTLPLGGRDAHPDHHAAVRL